MSAVNPVPTSGQGTSEKRSYEPSMEEILASIRRIIADDQSVPRYPEIDPGMSAAGLGEDVLRPSVPPVASAPEPSPFPDPRAQSAPHPESVTMTPDPMPPLPDAPPIARVAEVAPFPLVPPLTPTPSETPIAHQPAVAPQFPIPHGPVGDDIAPPPPEPSRPAAAAVAEEKPAPPPPPPFPDHFGSAHSAPVDDDEALYDTPIEPPGPSAARGTTASLFSETTDSSVSSAFNLLAATRLADNSDELMNLAREMIRPLLRTWLDDNLPSMVERMVRAEIERVARGGR